MNLEQKKQLALEQDINVLLQNLGYQPVNRTQKDTWYISPFRPEEKTASFHVSSGKYVKSIWKDFGGGGERSGGNIINLVRDLKGMRYGQALDYIIAHTVGSPLGDLVRPVQARPSKSQNNAPDRHILRDAREITNPAIFRYLEEKRGLKRSVIKNYVKQVHFEDTKTGKSFFSAGIENLKNGYEINNQIGERKFKSTVPSSSKSISYFEVESGNNSVMVFEGFIDSLSFLVDNSLRKFPTHTIVLNSAEMEKEAINFIAAKGFDHVKGFFDNDKRGRQLKETFKEIFGDGFSDASFIYAGYNDYNQFLVTKRIGRIL